MVLRFTLQYLGLPSVEDIVVLKTYTLGYEPVPAAVHVR